jgi:hypothetical protein
MVEYRGATLDKIMWLAAAHYTKKMENPRRDEQTLEADMRSHWWDLHPRH